MQKIFKNKVIISLLIIIIIVLFGFNVLFFTPSCLIKYVMPAQKLIGQTIMQNENLNYSTLNYNPIVETESYKIYKRAYRQDKIVAALDNVVVTLNTDTGNNHLKIYPDYHSAVFSYRIQFNTKNFPGLLENSKISHCLLLSYMREVKDGTHQKSWRLVVITDRGQIYHNYPARDKKVDGKSKAEDMIKFEESAIWDLPRRKYPVNTQKCASTERYYPGLPQEAYRYYPISNTDKEFKDVYGNGGFGKTTEVVEDGKNVLVPRFYIPLRESNGNPFFYMGGYENDSKMSVLGTYRSNTSVGVRTAVFASDDGGRNWYCKYEFGDFGEYDFYQGNDTIGENFGNRIDTSENNATYSTKSLSVSKRTIIAPTNHEKEPKTKFDWSKPVEISGIQNGPDTIIKTKEKHQLKTGNIIAIIGNSQSSDNWNWLTNNNVSPTSAGNGLMFKLKRIDDYSFQLYEYVSSPDNNITCRHIHHINRIKDGWVIGTGEIYPNGWMLYMQMKEADTFSYKSAKEEFKFVRLNSSKSSVQRSLGMILKDDTKGTIVFASDHDLLERDPVKMPDGRLEEFSRNSTGIYIGELKNIDDFSEFNVIYEAREPAFFFKELGKAWVFSGQRGEFAISFDKGLSWKKEQLEDPLIYYYGHTLTYQVISDYILVYK